MACSLFCQYFHQKIKEVDPEDLKLTRAFLCNLVSEQDAANPSSRAIKYTPNGDKVKDKWTSVVFLAMVTTNHTRHKDILCNHGFTNARYHPSSPENNENGAPIIHVSRRVTSKGDRIIAGYDCEVTQREAQMQRCIRSIVRYLTERARGMEALLLLRW